MRIRRLVPVLVPTIRASGFVARSRRYFALYTPTHKHVVHQARTVLCGRVFARIRCRVAARCVAVRYTREREGLRAQRATRGESRAVCTMVVYYTNTCGQYSGTVGRDAQV